ncbi:hypothetical protein IV55_GL000524 [Furfurilactobacillus siliginis]|nr:hypothetical protein IV55_GL000524 [Furfurilactobacillus siliginis]
MISFTSILFLGGIRGILSTFAEFFLIFIFLLAVLVNSVVFTIESKKYLRLLKEADKLSKLDYLSFFIALLAIFIAVF